MDRWQELAPDDAALADAAAMVVAAVRPEAPDSFVGDVGADAAVVVVAGADIAARLHGAPGVAPEPVLWDALGEVGPRAARHVGDAVAAGLADVLRGRRGR